MMVSSTLLSAKRRVAHYSPQRIGCSTTSTMIACVDSPHCCSGRVLGVALGLVRSPVHWISCKKLLARPVPSRVWSPTPSATPPPPTGSLLAALLATLPQQRAPLVTCDKKEFSARVGNNVLRIDLAMFQIFWTRAWLYMWLGTGCDKI